MKNRIKYFSILVGIMLLSWAGQAQNAITVKGKVTDAGNGEPLPGVNVLIKGASMGSATNVEGEYQLEVPSNETVLVFSFVGYRSREIRVGDKRVIDVALQQKVEQLNEVVVTGQGAGTERKRLSTSVEQLSSEDLEQIPDLQLDQILQGQLPGTQIRMNSGQPGTASVIRMRGILSADGAATPVIYIDGVRMDNTLLGDGTGGKGVDTGGASSSALSDIPVENIERIEVIKGGAASTLYGSDAANGVIQIFTKKGQSGEGSFHFNTQQGFMEGTRDYLRFQETGDIVFEPGHIQKYEVGVSGGNENQTYRFDGSAYRDNGFQLANDNTKYNLRLSSSASITDDFDYSGSFGFVSQQFSRSYNAAEQFSQFGELELGFTPGGLDNSYSLFNELSEQELSTLKSTARNIINKFDLKTRSRRFQTGHTFNYRPFEFLRAKATLGLDYRFSREKENYSPGLDRALGPAGEGDSEINVFERHFLGLTGQFDVQYSQDVGDFSIVSNMGYQFWNDRDEQTFYSGFNTLQGTSSINDAANQTASDGLLHVVNSGFYGIANIGFKDRYFVELGGRVDQNSAFGDQVGAVAYPKAGFSYLLSAEPFMQNFLGDVVNLIKFRANYGESGNFPKPFSNLRTFDTNPYLNNLSLTFGQIGNDSLSPEVTKTFEGGMDLVLLDDRVQFNATYYRSITHDAIFNAPYAPSEGQNNQRINGGKVYNAGLELSSSIKAIEQENVQLSINGSYNTNQNEVLESDVDVPFFLYGQDFVGAYVKEGQPLGYLRGHKAAFDEEGDYDPENSEQNAALGRITPEIYGSIGVNLSLNKKWRFMMSGDYQTGASFVNVNQADIYEVNAANLEGELPDPVINSLMSSTDVANYFVKSADYFKIRKISLSYRFGQDWLNKWPFKRLSLGFSVSNPFNFVKTGADPEVSGVNPSTQNSVNLGGFNYATTSPPRIYMLKMRSEF